MKKKNKAKLIMLLIPELFFFKIKKVFSMGLLTLRHMTVIGNIIYTIKALLKLSFEPLLSECWHKNFYHQIKFRMIWFFFFSWINTLLLKKLNSAWFDSWTMPQSSISCINCQLFQYGPWSFKNVLATLSSSCINAILILANLSSSC